MGAWFQTLENTTADNTQLTKIAPVDTHPVTLPHFAGIKKLITKASSGNITAANAQLMVNES